MTVFSSVVRSVCSPELSYTLTGTYQTRMSQLSNHKSTSGCGHCNIAAHGAQCSTVSRCGEDGQMFCRASSAEALQFMEKTWLRASISFWQSWHLFPFLQPRQIRLKTEVFQWSVSLVRSSDLSKDGHLAKKMTFAHTSARLMLAVQVTAQRFSSWN